jgi:hypothetical protein
LFQYNLLCDKTNKKLYRYRVYERERHLVARIGSHLKSRETPSIVELEYDLLNLKTCDSCYTRTEVARYEPLSRLLLISSFLLFLLVQYISCFYCFNTFSCYDLLLRMMQFIVNVKLGDKSKIRILNLTHVNQVSHIINLRKESEMYKDMTNEFNK